MNTIVKIIAQLTIKFRYLILIFVGLSTIFWAYQMKNIRMYHSLYDIAPPKHPYIMLDKYMTEHFGGNNVVVVGLMVKDGDIFNEKILGKIFRITTRIERLRGVDEGKVLSIAARKLKYGLELQ